MSVIKPENADWDRVPLPYRPHAYRGGVEVKSGEHIGFIPRGKTEPTADPKSASVLQPG